MCNWSILYLGDVSGRNTKKSSNEKRHRVHIDAERLFSQEDFDLLDRLKMARSNLKADSNAQENKIFDATDASSYTFNSSSLEASTRTTKSSKLERILKCLEGRKEHSFSNNGHRGGLTNKEKLRKKNFLMVRRGKRSIVSKVSKSNSHARWEKMNQVCYLWLKYEQFPL